MSINYVSGKILATNLARDGVDLSIETDLLYLDCANDRIGINNASPLVALDVTGALTVSGSAAAAKIAVTSANNTPTDVDLAIGDSNTGFYNGTTNGARFAVNGQYNWNVAAWSMSSAANFGAYILWLNSTTAPTWTWVSDGDTGLGRPAADTVALYAGGLEGIRVSEANGNILSTMGGTEVENVTGASTTAGVATLTKAGENFLTTCSVGDVVFVYGGTTVADYGTYIISYVGSDTVLQLGTKTFSASNTDVDFYVISNTVAIENSLALPAKITLPKLEVSLVSGETSAAIISNNIAAGNGIVKDYALQVLCTNPNSNAVNRGLYIESSGASVNEALRVNGLSYFEGQVDMTGNGIVNAGNFFMKDIPTANEGNLLVGDDTSNFAAGFGGRIAFSGDVVGQAAQGFRSVFASIQGIKETGGYQDSRGALVFGTQDLATDVAKLGTVTEKFRMNYAGQLVSSVVGTAALPTYAFGDGDTGFYESSDDVLRASIAGVNKMTITANDFQGGVADAFLIKLVAGQATVPMFTNLSDQDTGMTPLGDVLYFLAGGVEGLRVTETAGAITVDVNGSLAFPTVGDGVVFGDGDSHLKESSDDIVLLTTGASNVTFHPSYINFGNSAQPQIQKENPSSTNPVFLPTASDTDTGLGWAIEDQLSLIAGGVEGIRITEGTGAITVNVNGDLNIDTVGDKLSFGDGDTYIAEITADDNLSVYNTNLERWRWLPTFTMSFAPLRGSIGSDPDINFGTASSISAIAFQPNQSDDDSGFTWQSADSVSIVSGGVEGIRVSEANGDLLQTFGGTEVENITDASTTAAVATLTKAGENFLTTCSIGDIVFVNGGTTAADYGTYIIQTVTSDEVLTLDRPFSATNTDVDFVVINNSIAIENSQTTTPTLVLPTGTAGTPTLAFGDGDTGITQTADDTLKFYNGNVNTLSLLANYATFGSTGNIAYIDFSPATSTNPVFAFLSDLDTGLGNAGTDQLSLIAGAVEIMRLTEVGGVPQAIVPLSNTAATPTIAFGDGDTGFFESADDVLRIAIAGATVWTIDASTFGSTATGRPIMRNEIASVTNPTFTPYGGDSDTGLGADGADTLSLIAGGVEGIRVAEAASAITVTVTDDLTVTGNILAKTVTFGSEIANTTTTQTIDWTAGQKQNTTITAATGMTFTAPAGPCNLLLKVINGGAGVITWPATVKWSGATEPTWTVSGTDIASFYFDGTNYYGQAGIGFA